MTITNEILSDWRAKAEAATPGPWVLGDEKGGDANLMYAEGFGFWIAQFGNGDLRDDADNGAFATTSCNNAIPALERIARLEAALRGMLDNALSSQGENGQLAVMQARAAIYGERND